jgi:hypothetical protein
MLDWLRLNSLEKGFQEFTIYEETQNSWVYFKKLLEHSYPIAYNLPKI